MTGTLAVFTRLRFFVMAAFGQGGWALLLTLLCLLAALYLVWRYRQARLLELERMRLRIAADLHDDIGASLSQIAVLSEVLHRQVGHHDTHLCDTMLSMARVSREAVDSMSDIVWAVNPQQDYLRNLVRRMRRFASEILPASGIEFTFRTAEADSPIRLEAALRQQVFLIFKESINNLVRHAGCTRADLELHLDGLQMILRISDNGSGFDTGNAEQTGKGNGLASLYRRAESIGGALEITSQRGGTTVTLAVKHSRSRWAGFRHKAAGKLQEALFSTPVPTIRTPAVPYLNRGVTLPAALHKLSSSDQSQAISTINGRP